MQVLVVVGLVAGEESLLVHQITGDVFPKLNGAAQCHLLPFGMPIPFNKSAMQQRLNLIEEERKVDVEQAVFLLAQHGITQGLQLKRT